jgi:uncharacterized membrane protein YfcA
VVNAAGGCLVALLGAFVGLGIGIALVNPLLSGVNDMSWIILVVLLCLVGMAGGAALASWAWWWWRSTKRKGEAT